MEPRSGVARKHAGSVGDACLVEGDAEVSLGEACDGITLCWVRGEEAVGRVEHVGEFGAGGVV